MTMAQVAPKANRRFISLGIVLLVVGLLGHLMAAHGTGGTSIDYQHHILGFVFLAVVSTPIIAALGSFFWKGRHDITLLLVGALQAALGLIIYFEFTA